MINLNKYFKKYVNLLNFSKNDLSKILLVKNLFEKIKKNNKKILIFGNGGSSAIASHFSVDITKNAKIRCVNFNEADLITCFSNDYGYENWIKKSLEYYHDEGDVLILISSSGKSRNIINAAKYAVKKEIKLITLSGIDKNNTLYSLGDINFFVKSNSYNIVECVHQIILLSIVDLIIGKSNYSNKL
jgi:D-sedoheptulose 7-phosphate isomerase